MYYTKEFRLYAVSGRGPLKGFKQGNDILMLKKISLEPLLEILGKRLKTI